MAEFYVRAGRNNDSVELIDINQVMSINMKGECMTVAFGNRCIYVYDKESQAKILEEFDKPR